jgi:general secretion pathway protein K
MRSQRGAALLMVLMAMALVSMTLTALTLQGQRQLTRLQLQQQATQARFYVRGAEIIAQRALTDAAVRQAALWWQTLAGQPLDYPTDEGSLRLVVKDLRSCFNVNSLAGEAPALAQQQLLYWLANRPDAAADGLSPGELVSRLTDWVDADNISREGGMDGADYARLEPPRLSADSVMRDASELNWLAPLDSDRYRRLDALCAIPDSGPWRLNLNALDADDLTLLDALFVGEVNRADLATLITARPPGGYDSLDAVRAALGGDAPWLSQLGSRLTLTPDHLALHIRITLDGHSYYFYRHLLAEGTSAFHPRQPAARVQVLSRRSGDASSWPRIDSPPRMEPF